MKPGIVWVAGHLYDRMDPQLKKLFPELYGEAKPLPKEKKSDKPKATQGCGC